MDRFEFLVYMLTHTGKLAAEDVEAVMRTFHRRDLPRRTPAYTPPHITESPLRPPASRRHSPLPRPRPTTARAWPVLSLGAWHRYDLDGSGTIDFNDVAIVNARAGVEGAAALGLGGPR